MKITLEYEDLKFGIGIYENSQLISHSWIDKDIDEYKVFNIVRNLFKQSEINKFHIGYNNKYMH